MREKRAEFLHSTAEIQPLFVPVSILSFLYSPETSVRLIISS